MTKEATGYKGYSIIFAAIILIVFFILVSLLADRYEENIVRTLGVAPTWLAMLGYVVLTITSVVIAPFATLPIIPIFVVKWGVLVTALLTLVGWQVGAMIAFAISRRFGRKIVAKLASVELLDRLERLLPKKKNIFWMIIALRIAVPVDELSYVLGLFTSISFTSYSIATLIGIMPGSFIFAYLGSIPVAWQLTSLSVIGLILFLVWRRLKLFSE